MGDVYMVNGKILSGLPNHAKDIEFDNTDSPLSSTNTEDAIKEVSSNLTTQIIADEATYSLVKTGNICVFTISGIVPTSGIYNAYSIPLACRPNKTTRGIVTSDDCTKFARVTIETGTNTVVIYNATASVAMYGQVVWTV